MTEALLFCLSHIGRGNPQNWQSEAAYQGGFTLPDRFKPYTQCHYNTRGIELYGKSVGAKKFTASMCDAVARPKKVVPQLTLGL